MSLTPQDVNAFMAEAFVGGTPNECVEIGERHAVARYAVRAEGLRVGGFVSGPTLFAMADAVLWYALFGAVGIEPMAMTSELSMRFLRPAAGEALYGRAELHQVGRRNVVGTIVLWMDERADRLVAVGQGTYTRPAAAP